MILSKSACRAAAALFEYDEKRPEFNFSAISVRTVSAHALSSVLPELSPLKHLPRSSFLLERLKTSAKREGSLRTGSSFLAD